MERFVYKHEIIEHPTESAESFIKTKGYDGWEYAGFLPAKLNGFIKLVFKQRQITAEERLKKKLEEINRKYSKL